MTAAAAKPIKRSALLGQAEQIAKALSSQPAGSKHWSENWEALRDEVNWRTGGDMDCQPLDILTDMVAKRLKKTA